MMIVLVLENPHTVQMWRYILISLLVVHILVLFKITEVLSPSLTFIFIFLGFSHFQKGGSATNLTPFLLRWRVRFNEPFDFFLELRFLFVDLAIILGFPLRKWLNPHVLGFCSSPSIKLILKQMLASLVLENWKPKHLFFQITAAQIILILEIGREILIQSGTWLRTFASLTGVLEHNLFKLLLQFLILFSEVNILLHDALRSLGDQTTELLFQLNPDISFFLDFFPEENNLLILWGFLLAHLGSPQVGSLKYSLLGPICKLQSRKSLSRST